MNPMNCEIDVFILNRNTFIQFFIAAAKMLLLSDNILKLNILTASRSNLDEKMVNRDSLF